MQRRAAPPRAKVPWQKEEKAPNANDNGRRSPVLGVWKGAEFKFNSSEAEAEWVRNAYRSGVNEKNWHLGKVVDDKNRDVILAGIGGPQGGIYPAPDGTYRTINPKTIEDQAARDHRTQHMRGKTIDQIASMAKMPGEDEWVEHWAVKHLPLSAPKATPVTTSAAQAAASPAANDNEGKAPVTGSVTATGTQPATSTRLASMAPRTAPPAPVNDRQEKAARQKSPGEIPGSVKNARQETRPLIQRAAAGRSGVMPPALAAAERQAVNDTGRILLHSVTGEYGDHLRAGASAVGDMLEGKSFMESFNQHLPEEEHKTAAAKERQGWKGTAAEMAVGAIPVIGDLSGAAADFKDWKENGDNWGWQDYGLVALGLVPGMANRKTINCAVKIADDLIGDGKKAGEEIADLAKKDANPWKAESSTHDHRAELEKAQAKVYTEKEARRLGGENRGLIISRKRCRAPNARRSINPAVEAPSAISSHGSPPTRLCVSTIRTRAAGVISGSIAPIRLLITAIPSWWTARQSWRFGAKRHKQKRSRPWSVSSTLSGKTQAIKSSMSLIRMRQRKKPGDSLRSITILTMSLWG